MNGYTSAHARAGIDTRLPRIETWPNQFPGYQITIRVPEYTRAAETMLGVEGFQNVSPGLPQSGYLL
jgi:hypothetical protein